MTNWIIGLIVAALVVVGGGYYVMSSGSYSMSEESRVGDFDQDGMPDSTMSDTGDAAEQEADAVAGDKSSPKLAESAAKFSGSWFDLATRGGNYVCEVNHSSSLDISEGTVYVSGTKVRGDFTSMVNGASVASHMLKTGDMLYVWGGGMTEGIKMPASMQQGQGGTQTSGQGVDQNQKYDWNCRATGTDASTFVPPSDIKFMDMSAMMQGAGMMPGSAGTR